MVRYLFYILRWGLLAVPGHYFLGYARVAMGEGMPSMIASQVALGAIVFFIDRFIFTWSPNNGKSRCDLS